MITELAKKQVEAALAQALQNKELAGATIKVVKNGQELFYHEAGYANIELQQPITRDAIYRMYSMTKPVTAVIAMIAMEQGLIELFAPVSKYLPGFINQKVASSGEFVAVKRPMTVMDLLSMTSGLLYGGPCPAGQKTGEMWMELDQRLLGDNPMNTQEAMNLLGQAPLAFQPGTAWEYGTSADVLGAVIEVATGKQLSVYMDEVLFQPLGMVDTAFYVPEAKRSRLVTTYERTESGELIPYLGNNLGIINAMDRPPAFESAGAGLASTLDDYGKFTQMLIDGGTYKGVQILRPKTVQYLTNKVLTAQQQVNFTNWNELAGHSYGNLMRIVTEPALAGGITCLGEYGWDGWLGAYFSNCPNEALTLLIMMQHKDAGTTTLTRKIRNIVLSEVR